MLGDLRVVGWLTRPRLFLLSCVCVCVCVYPSFIRETPTTPIIIPSSRAERENRNKKKFGQIVSSLGEEEALGDEFVLEIFFPAYPNIGGSDRPVGPLPGLVPSQLDSS